jgi:hypothetical protein
VPKICNSRTGYQNSLYKWSDLKPKPVYISVN